MGVIVSLAVLFAGFNIAKDTLKPLLGEAIDREVYDGITAKVESYEGILGSHDLIVHNYGPTHSMATIHAEVSNESDIEAAHELIDRIEAALGDATGGLTATGGKLESRRLWKNSSRMPPSMISAW